MLSLLKFHFGMFPFLRYCTQQQSITHTDPREWRQGSGRVEGSAGVTGGVKPGSQIWSRLEGGTSTRPQPAIRDYADRCPYLPLQHPRSQLTELGTVNQLLTRDVLLSQETGQHQTSRFWATNHCRAARFIAALSRCCDTSTADWG